MNRAQLRALLLDLLDVEELLRTGFACHAANVLHDARLRVMAAVLAEEEADTEDASRRRIFLTKMQTPALILTGPGVGNFDLDLEGDSG